MIEIGNKELYYETSMYPETRRVDHNLVYKTLPRMTPKTKSSSIRLKIMELFGVEIHSRRVGQMLAEMAERGYVVREYDNDNYKREGLYTVTDRLYETYYNPKPSRTTGLS